MNNEHRLKNQIFISIGLAVLIIIGSSVYLFTSLTNFSKYNSTVIEKAQIKLETLTNLHYNIFKLVTDIENNENTSANTQYYISLITQDLAKLKALTSINEDKDIIEFLNQTEAIVTIVMNNEINIERSIIQKVDWTKELENTVLAFNEYIESVILHRNIKLTNNESQFNTIKYNIICCIIICLLVIIYAVYKFYVAIKNLEKSTSDLKKINKEFDEAKIDIENTNWVLEQNTRITDNIRGLDDTSKIGQITLSTLNEILPLQAATIYIREPNSNKFCLVEQIGTNKENILESFISGDGYLGKLVDDKKLVIETIKNKDHLNTYSSLIKEFKTITFICPLVHENLSIGLLELAINVEGAKEVQKLHNFFLRISNTVAGKIKFGQSHVLVQQLLQETQRQTHELEARQEELRITNEELIHKTNLIESSEEELSVQQEELFQTNIELTQKALELEKRNSELILTQKIVKQTIKEVEQASKYKSEFMANMSHELRTPLNSILILAKLLQENKFKNLNPEQIKYAGVIHGAGTDLLELINELLDLAKIESGKIELYPESISTKAFTNELTELFSTISTEKGINFQTIIDTSVPDEFITDEHRLQQVIKNFLSNAFKFTDKGGEITFSILKNEKQLIFQVKDNGKGISLEKQELIFEAFKQEDGSTSRKYGGTGLGLSISKQIASLLNGEITLESEIGIGSTFSIMIPTHTIPNTPKSAKKEIVKQEIIFQEPKETCSSINKKPQLLIIEDDINFADILKGFAEENGYVATLAHDGIKGIEIAKDIIPDAIILDINLPLLDGWDVLKSLKNNSITEHIPIHMMSGTIFDKNDLLEKGAIGFMHKPVSKKNIQNTFDNISININKTVKKILLVENQEIQNDLIKSSFIKLNAQIIQVFTSESALEKLKNETDFDCIIIDIQSTESNGIELIKIIKEDPKLIDIPIIIYTASKLTKELNKQILTITGTTIIKSEKLNEKLIDEVNLFLNKIKKQNNHTYKVGEKTNRPNNLKAKTVLIADDDMRNIFALTSSLQGYDMTIEIANTGKEAVEIIKTLGDKIDIVLMDIMMPEMDGYEAINIIRNELNYTHLPILAVTAKAMKGDNEKSLQSGANDYISKPIDINKLTSLMNVWLS